MKPHSPIPDKVKRSIICKDVNANRYRSELNSAFIPIAGDVAIFKVLEIGKHTRIQCVSGRNVHILPGDHIMAAFGNRYASGQMEGYVPSLPHLEYDILGQGGVIGRLESINSQYEDVGTTRVALVGYVVDEQDQVVNTVKIAKPLQAFEPVPGDKTYKLILSLGTAMDSGKTSSAGFLAHGLDQCGKRSAYFKLTGTVYSKDKNFVKDYGTDYAIDFTAYGYPSTYMCALPELLDLYQSLLNQALESEPDYVIVEIADGLLERETKALIEHIPFKEHVDGVLFSAGDSLSAISGAQELIRLGYPLLGLTGLFSASPLLIKEVEKHSNFGVLTREQLMSEEILVLLSKAEQRIARYYEKMGPH